MAEPTTPRKRKRHPAVVGRVMATGISTAALLGVVAGLAHDAAGGPGEALPIPEPLTPSTTVPVTPPPVPAVTPETVVVVREIHRTVYVDENGNLVGPPTAAAAAPAPAGRSSRSTAAPATPPPPQAAPAPPPPPPPAAKPSPPACSGSKCP